jgi:hypothetical protein
LVELIMTDQIGDLVEGTFDLAVHAGSAPAQLRFELPYWPFE